MKNQLITMKSFYNINRINISNIDNVRLSKIIEQSKPINKIFLNERLKKTKSERYFKIMELIHSNYRKNNPVNNEFATTLEVEKFLLFLFSVDPKFEMAIIHATEDRTYNIKNKIREKFGVYDPYLIIIEKAVIKKLLNKEKQEEIFEEIKKRVFK